MRVEDYLRDNARRLGGKIALIDGDACLSFSDLDLMSNRMAAALAADGIVPGDRVLVFMDNSWKAVVSILAVLKAGAVCCAVDPATGPDGLAGIAQSCHAVGLVTQSRLATATADAMARATSLRLVVVADCQGAPAIDGLLRFEDAIIAEGAAPALPSATGSDAAAILFSPASAPARALTHDALDKAVAPVAALRDDTGEPLVRCVRPFTVDEGLYRIVAAVRLGATLVLERPAARLEGAEGGRVASSDRIGRMTSAGGGDLPWAI